MIESVDSRRSDGVYWRCRDRLCSRDASIRSGSFFNHSKLELEQIIDILYTYLYETVSCFGLRM